MQYVNIKQSKSFLNIFNFFIKKHFILLQIIFLLLISLFLLLVDLVKPHTFASNKLTISIHMVNFLSNTLQPFYIYPNFALNWITTQYKLRNLLNDLQRTLENTPSIEELNRLIIENQQLRTLINYQNNLKQFMGLTTRVVGFPIKKFSHYIILPVGRKNKINENYAVIDKNGLVGKIVEVSDKFSKAILITDVNFRATVKTTQTNCKAILAGQNTDYPNLLYLPSNLQLLNNEILITSGDTPFFPPDIIVGYVHPPNKVKLNFLDKELDYVTVLIPLE